MFEASQQIFRRYECVAALSSLPGGGLHNKCFKQNPTRTDNCPLREEGNLKIFHCYETLATYPYAIKNQRKARNAPSRGLWVP